MSANEQRRQFRPARVAVAGAAGALVVGVSIGGWLMVRNHPSQSPPAPALTSNSIAHSSPGSSIAPAVSTQAGNRILLPLGSAPSINVRVLDWNGHVVPSTISSTSVPIMNFLGQSPDGSRFVADTGTGTSVVRSVLSTDGQVLGSLDQQSQFRWADDNEHLCQVRNPNPGAGAQSLLEVSDLGRSVRMLGGLGAGDGAHDAVHEVAACSVKRNLVVVLDEKLVADGASVGAATTAIREFSLSGFQLIRQYNTSAIAIRVTSSPDGQFFDEETLGTPFKSRIVRGSDGSIVTTLDNLIVLGFTGDNQNMVVALQTNSPSTDRVELRRVQDASILATLPGHITDMLLNPATGEVFLALSTNPGPDRFANARLVILRATGAVVSLAPA